MKITVQKIKGALRKVIDPHTSLDILKMDMVKKIEIKGKKILITFCPTTPFCPLIHFLKDNMIKEVKKIAPSFDVKVKVVTYLD